jgi:hypothetical protein
MKVIFLLTCSILLIGCGGSLSDEQRKRLHEGMEDQKIIKLTDSEIVTASLERGRKIFKAMENLNFSSLKMDSLASQNHVRIRLIKTGTDNALEVEKQLIEAYIVGAETGALQENIQKMNVRNDNTDYDSLIYTRPKISPLPEGAVQVEGIWNIYLSKKEVIRTIDEK